MPDARDIIAALVTEIDRLRAERHQARAALGTTPDTGSTP